MRSLTIPFRTRVYRHPPTLLYSPFREAYSLRRVSSMAETQASPGAPVSEEKLSPSDYKVYNSMAEHMDYFVGTCRYSSPENIHSFIRSIPTFALLGKRFTPHVRAAKDLRVCP